jgi:hypothetical protein
MNPPTNNWRWRRTNKTWVLLQTTGGEDEQARHEPSYKQLEVKTNKQDMSPPTNNWRWRQTNKTWALLQTTGGKDEQTRHEPSYKQLEVKTNKQNMSPPTNNWRWRRTNKKWALLQTTTGKDEQTRHELSYFVCSSSAPVVCRRAHVLFVCLYLQLFVGGLMYCLFVFTSSCL